MSRSIVPALLCLHLGVHKTATTYIQSVLERSYWKEGYFYIGPWVSRESIISRDPELADVVPDVIRRDDIVVLSDENLLGNAAAGLAFYPRPERHLAWARHLKVSICLCVRDYADFLSSAWVESLRHGAFRPQARKVRNGGYVGLLERLERLLPNADFFVWNYASFRDRRDEILDIISSHGLAKLAVDGVGDQRPSPSWGVVTTYLQLRNLVEGPKQAELMRKLISNRNISGNGEKFNSYPEEDRKVLSEQFATDLEIIASRYRTLR